jgi:phenylpyruvate tautomerase PptA (4-oxalocrotonate tautomerase family)
MPLVRVQLSVAVDPKTEQSILKSLSSAVASLLGKPESYMMAVLEPRAAILMGASPEPAALCEVRSVGTISGAQAASLSAKICEILSQQAKVPGDRIYLNLAGVPGAMWGHDGGTFG